jgi:hypothetical protein
MAEILNPRIDQLADGTPAPDDYFAFRDMVTGVTRRVKANQIITAAATQDFEWISDKDPAYQEDEVVTYGGKWWQSEVNDNESVPGANSDWTELSKSPSGFVFWQAGVFPEDEVFVLFQLGETVELFRLNTDEDRPFVSSNFVNELQAGTWIQVTNSVELKEFDVDESGVVIDFYNKAKINHVASDAITEAKTWVFENYSLLKESKVKFIIENPEDVQTLPSGVRVLTNAGDFDSSTGEWIPYNSGYYEFIISGDGTNLSIKIEGPYSDVVSS